MIDVIASIRIKPGHVKQFVALFNTNVPAVLAEKGCISYYPTLDVDSGLELQQQDANTVTVVEKWESIPALEAHLKAPHMLVFREKAKDMIESLSLRVLQKA